ncbi:hypothetical protein [Bifidobacterium coryneforme]|uniref:Uncharacterized protein n=1 Tax=Bifidobacterium coryneforme TaxID=1687 RepID=A0ABD4AEX1_9BIFI|nr:MULTISPECIES: hypothetical protein [Bifidobacterium]KJY53293.1 Uncharacterized protein JF68_06320 [Bifidobacterium coryneforme]PXY80240.1 hypothetical protein DKK72_03120 [Bifidobacterium indicum]
MILMNDKNPREEIAKIFANCGDPMDAAVKWAQNIAASQEINPNKDKIVFIRELRREEPSLDLKTATYLARMTARVS